MNVGVLGLNTQCVQVFSARLQRPLVSARSNEPAADWLSGCQDCLQETWLPGLLESSKKWKVSKCVKTKPSWDCISWENWR